MLWKTLCNKIGKQPARVTRRKHVLAIIEDKHYELDMKFMADGTPYLVPREAKPPKPPKPYDKVYWYEVSEEACNPLGSGSDTRWSKTCGTEKEAFDVLKKLGGNTIIRKVRATRGKKTVITTHWYDFIDKCWRDNDYNRLAY